jgi:hypothetical protein
MPCIKGQPKTPGSGRKKGSKNTQSFDAVLLSKELGIDPVEILLHFANGDWKKLGYDSKTTICYNSAGIEYLRYEISSETRMLAAKEAAKYIYSPKKIIEVGTAADGFNVNVRDYTSKKE